MSVKFIIQCNMGFLRASPAEKLFKLFYRSHDKRVYPLLSERLICRCSLRSFFLHGSKGRSCNLNSFSRSVFHCDLYRSQVWKLSSLCLVVCVRNIVSYQWAFSRYWTSSWHDISFIELRSLWTNVKNLCDYRQNEHKICLNRLKAVWDKHSYLRCAIIRHFNTLGISC